MTLVLQNLSVHDYKTVQTLTQTIVSVDVVNPEALIYHEG